MPKHATPKRRNGVKGFIAGAALAALAALSSVALADSPASPSAQDNLSALQSHLAAAQADASALAGQLPTSESQTPSAPVSESPSASDTPTPTPSDTATPTASPSPSASATGSTGGCVPNPSACGYPDATNTGVPAGYALTSHPGSQTITQDGAVIDGWDTGSIEIKASNVTIRNTRITPTGYFGIHVQGGKGWGNITVENVTIAGVPSVNCSTGVDVGSVTVTRTDISGCADGIHLHGNNVVQDSYIHDLLKLPNAYFPDAANTHNDGIQVFSDYDAVVQHNTISLGTIYNNAAIFVQPSSASTGMTIDNNLLDGGGYTLYIEAGAGIVASNNRIGPLHNFGRISTAHGGTPTLTGNVADETGQPLS